jgi:hypothetical protein
MRCLVLLSFEILPSGGPQPGPFFLSKLSCLGRVQAGKPSGAARKRKAPEEEEDKQGPDIAQPPAKRHLKDVLLGMLPWPRSPAAPTAAPQGPDGVPQQPSSPQEDVKEVVEKPEAEQDGPGATGGDARRPKGSKKATRTARSSAAGSSKAKAKEAPVAPARGSMRRTRSSSVLLEDAQAPAQEPAGPSASQAVAGSRDSMPPPDVRESEDAANKLEDGSKPEPSEGAQPGARVLLHRRASLPAMIDEVPGCLVRLEKQLGFGTSGVCLQCENT